jgi:hypothetical protein
MERVTPIELPVGRRPKAVGIVESRPITPVFALALLADA